uniref:Uncharacterized protein n=1 Tax=Lactuca sativa TaxID=4236 RepID=A0A9R1VUS9_LACSA|nr:hypothetical protein LSAT_V11C400174820 [Lactuca sativa]
MIHHSISTPLIILDGYTLMTCSQMEIINVKLLQCWFHWRNHQKNSNRFQGLHALDDKRCDDKRMVEYRYGKGDPNKCQLCYHVSRNLGRLEGTL